MSAPPRISHDLEAHAPKCCTFFSIELIDGGQGLQRFDARRIAAPMAGIDRGCESQGIEQRFASAIDPRHSMGLLRRPTRRTPPFVLRFSVPPFVKTVTSVHLRCRLRCRLTV